MSSTELEVTPRGEARVRLAELLSMGYSLQKACEISGVPYRTAHRWYVTPGKEEFRALVQSYKRTWGSRYYEKLAAIVELAMVAETRALTGELDPNEPSVQLAHKVLSRTVYRVAPHGGAKG